MNKRCGKVYVQDIYAGKIAEDDDGYVFSYDPGVICDTCVFDQDGELLTPVNETNGLARFAVQGKKLTELHNLRLI